MKTSFDALLLSPDKMLAFRLFLSTALIVVFTSSAFAEGACEGALNCAVCTDCSRCWHCSVQGKSCGVCSSDVELENPYKGLPLDQLYEHAFELVVSTLEADRITSLFFLEMIEKPAEMTRDDAIKQLEKARDYYVTKVSRYTDGETGETLAMAVAEMRPDELDYLVGLLPHLSNVDGPRQVIRANGFLLAFRGMSEAQLKRLNTLIEFMRTEDEAVRDVQVEQINAATQDYCIYRRAIHLTVHPSE